VLDGPPGTGKSQTIANVIAESAGHWKNRVVCHREAAALEVVKRRLDACNLGDFCLECHSHKANKKRLLPNWDVVSHFPWRISNQASELERCVRFVTDSIPMCVRFHKATVP